MGDQMYPVGNFDQGGIVIDSNPFSLSPTEWSGGRNVRFDNRSVSKITGEEVHGRPVGTGRIRSILPLPVVNNPTFATSYIYIDSTGQVRRILGPSTASSDVSQGTNLSNAPVGKYKASLFNGGLTYVVCDGVTTPKFAQPILGYYDTVGETFNTGLEDLPNWDYDSTFSSVIPQVIRPFRNVLVAANLIYTRAANGAVTRAPGTIRVSSIAAPGDIPQNWDPASASPGTAEEIDLADSSPIVDLVSFQNNLLVFTENSIHSLTLTGNDQLPVSTQKVLEGRGLLQADCAVEFYGRIFAVGHEDIYVYGGGASVQSVADGKVRDYFFDTFNGQLAFVIHNTRQDEIWICYSVGALEANDADAVATEALIWNYDNNTWTLRDLPQCAAGTYGPSAAETAGGVELFIGDSRPVFSSPLDASDLSDNDLFVVADTGTSFFEGDGSAVDNPVPINAFVERRGFDVIPNGTNFSKWTDSIYVLATGEGTVNIDVRPTDTPGRPVDFDSTTDSRLKSREFTLNGDMADFKVDPRTNGRYMNIRFGSNDTTSSWELVRYNMSFSADDEGRG